MPQISTGTTQIPFNTSLRIGYRLQGSNTPFTYLTAYPTQNDMPYTFVVPTAGAWEIEYTVLCPTCGGRRYSEPEIAVVAVGDTNGITGELTL